MKIDGTDGLGIHSSAEAAPPAAKPQSKANPSAADSVSSELQLKGQDAAYIKAALACDEVNSQAVKEARQLLQSGQLDTPEAIRNAAATILSTGI